MASTVFPAISKTRYVTTLTSGTSYTVPAGVTYVNVTLIGGGGGGSGSGGTSPYPTGVEGRGGQIVESNLATTPGASIAYAIGAGGTAAATSNSGGGNGGTTTFTGATSATGGNGASNNGGGVGTAGQSANNGSGGGLQNNGSAAGGAGAIYIEYWV
jgi:hypothetical protein